MIKNILTIVIGLAIIGALFAFVVPALPKQSADVQGCTMEAMICPDGTAVGRTGPNCEFEACPAPKPIAYTCADGKSLTATFTTDSVVLALSDGRTTSLARVGGGDGPEVQYVRQDTPIMFSVLDYSAFLQEGDVTTYAGCRVAELSFP